MEKETRIHQCSRTRRAYAFTVTGEWVGNTRMLINAVLGSYAEEPQLDRKHTGNWKVPGMSSRLPESYTQITLTVAISYA